MHTTNQIILHYHYQQVGIKKPGRPNANHHGPNENHRGIDTNLACVAYATVQLPLYVVFMCSSHFCLHWVIW